ncbi:hypothetical protein OG234_13390 [Streptomyces sp. NBC_01420]|uniref:hypothetical protein n=1 Tax=Streptomyces sp. NBC_01420 TaxID=2903858 RepID=UPI0032433BCF
MATTIPTAAAQVGKGRTPHYVRKDGFHADALCTRTVTRELTDAEAAKLGPFCKACVKALAALTAETETTETTEVPAATETPAPAAEQATPAPAPAVHHFDSTEEAYDATQCRDDIHDGDVLVIESQKVVGFLRDAWPGAITTAHGELHTFSTPARAIDNGMYAASVDLAEQIAQEIGADVDTLHASPAPAADVAPPAEAAFTEGDRVLCSDGLTRTVSHVSEANGRDWVHMDGGDACPATTSLRVDTSRVEEVTAQALRDAATLRAGVGTPDALIVDRLGQALRYLRQADPARHAALIKDADHISVRVARASIAPGDIRNEYGHPHEVLDACFAETGSDDATWWLRIIGTTEEGRAHTGRTAWNSSLRLDLALVEMETVDRPLPAAPAETAAPTVEAEAVDPTSPEFAPFSDGADRFYADVETRLAFPGHREDRIAIHRAGHSDPIDYIALPHVADRSAATVLAAFGWETVEGLEYIAGGNFHRGQVRRVEPSTTPEGEELRAAHLRHTIARSVALADHSGARHFRDVMPDDSGPYPIGWTYRVIGYGENSQYGWVTAQGRGMNRVGVPTREDAEGIVREWHATGQDTPNHTGLVDVLTDLPAGELGAVSAVLRGATERHDTPVQTVEAAQEAVAQLYPTADKFEPVNTQDGLLGYTFQVGKLHGARYGWVTCYGTYGKSLERRRSAARDMLPAQVADAERAAGLNVPAPAPTFEPAPAVEGTCVHGLTEREGDTSGPAAVCSAKEAAVSVGVFSDEGCVATRDCAVQAAAIVYQLNTVEENPAYRWAVCCPDHDEQPAIGCEDCATGEDDQDGDEPDEDGQAEAAPAFVTGDRIVCADGIARTVLGAARPVAGEPARILADDDTEWIAANCLPASPADVDAARDALTVAGARVREADVENPEWHKALAELGRLLDFLKAADPFIRAAIAEDEAKAAAIAVHADAHNFQPFTRHGEPGVVGWSFRAGHGADARYGVVTVDAKLSPVGLYEYRTTAERAHCYAERGGSAEGAAAGAQS